MSEIRNVIKRNISKCISVLRIVKVSFLMIIIAIPFKVFAFDNHNNFCMKPHLNISPSGHYIYTDGNHDNALLISIDCIIKSNFSACPVYEVPTHALNALSSVPLQFNFSADDKFLYYMTWDLDPDPILKKTYNAHGKVGIDQIDLDSLLSGTPMIKTLIGNKNFPIGWKYKYLQLLPDIKTQNDALQFYVYAANVYKNMYDISTELKFINNQDVWGSVFNEKYIMVKIDKEYNAYLYTDKITHKLISNDGLSYYYVLNSRLDDKGYFDSPEFKFADKGFYALVSGSIIAISQNGDTQNITPNESRAYYISGENPGIYYGYITHSAVHTENIRKDLESKIQTIRTENSISAISGLSVNNTADSLVMSFKKNINRSSEAGTHFFAHTLYVHNKTIELACANDKNFSFNQKKIGGDDGVWIDSYIIDPSFKTIIYLHGGPQTGMDINEPHNIDGLRYLFAAGFNVDVVHYGGTRFTYNLSNKLRRLGFDSFKRDVKDIEKYVKETYDPKKADLLLESFSGQFYRYFSQSGLEHFDKVVLNLPFGSYEVNEPQYERNRKNKEVGDEIFKAGYGNKFYDSLTSCPLKTPTFIVAGRKDDRINPLYDYRYCYGDPKLTLYIDDAGHVPNLYQMDIARQRRDAIVNYFLGK